MTKTEAYIAGFVIATDGTKIGYRQYGAGPGVILVHGGLIAAQNFNKLAQHLATDFTVYVPDRQGRGSSDTRTHHSLVAEGKDIRALINKTNAEYIFGLSSGAIITLQTAITAPSLKKVALYEPPIALDISIASKWYAKYELAIAKGDFGKAFRCIFKCIGDNSFLTALPAFITVPLFRLALKREEKNAAPNEVTIRSLIAAFKYDYKIVTDSAGILNKCADLKADVLLLGGSKSSGFLKTGLVQLAGVLPRVKKIELARVGHIAADNSGRPELVANQLKHFFKS